ncbi:sedoheptulose 7-phosphate cyclase [Streptomyces chartreusis]|uniref:sedoheptulose 7-phosphate cyclase n=1 Tax=Streptomyces chartreusis TaxID=1969 RepID=UPI002E180E10
MRAQHAVEYAVVRTRDVLDPANDDLAKAGAESEPARRCVVTDRTVERLYGDRLRAYFQARGIEARLVVLDSGEENKNIGAVMHVVEAFDALGLLRRQEPVVGVGGGVLTDIVGFACSTYRRGLPYVKVPTTLIGQVDAGIGAKTGVDHRGHKNRLGSYFPARAVLLDPAFLATLPERHIANGLAEILKLALVRDRRLFELLEQHGPRLLRERFQDLNPAAAGVADEVLQRAIGGMLAELEPNLWEDELERAVDYGHSISPALEMSVLPELLHGEAVAVDMALTTVVSCDRGLTSAADRDRVLEVLSALKLPATHPACRPELLDAALADTVRHRDGRQRIPLTTGVGTVRFADDVTRDELRAAAEFLWNRGGEPHEEGSRWPMN